MLSYHSPLDRRRPNIAAEPPNPEAKVSTRVHLARVRRDSDSDPEVAIRVPGPGPAGRPHALLPLAAVLGASAGDDPVAVATSSTVGELADEVARAARDGSVVLLNADQVVFEPPTPTCTKICCMALNYREHASESQLSVPGEPVWFLKPPSALVGHKASVRPPTRTRKVDHELELAVVIGQVTRDLPAHRWREAVAGYTVINDVTARDLQLRSMERNVPWDQSKGFDTFAPLGPYLVTADEVPDPLTLDMTLTVDGQVRQKANTSQMVFTVPEIIADLSDGMTLLPGDVIATGTTAGISSLKHGAVMVCTIDHVGTLVNEVIYPPSDDVRCAEPLTG